MAPKKAWTEEEDSFLRKKVQKIQKVNWTQIMESFHEEFPNRERSSKQCRERYINHSSLPIGDKKCFKWTQEDVEILYAEFIKYGTRWTRFTYALPGKYFIKQSRSENSIKNKFYGMLRKAVRTINNFGKNMRRKMKKSIRYESLVRIIQAPQCFQNLNTELKDESLFLRDKILAFMRFKVKVEFYDEVSELIKRINKFNLATRSYRPKRSRGITSQRNEIVRPENIKISNPISFEAEIRNLGNTSTQISPKVISSKKIPIQGIYSPKCNFNQEFNGIIKTRHSDSFIEFEQIHVSPQKQQPIELFDFLLNDQNKPDYVLECSNLLI